MRKNPDDSMLLWVGLAVAGYFLFFRGNADAAPAPLPVVLATAIPQGLAINSARYEAIDGAGGADVTAIVRTMVIGNSVSVDANNLSFGDPIVGHFKRLVVSYTRNGVPGSVTVPENGKLTL